MSAETRDLVSVIIPVFNGERYVRQAIESVLAQTYRPINIVVVDDGSTDDTAAIVQEFGAPVDYHYQANAGPSAARNAGVERSHGQFLSFLDADDLWEPEKLVLQVQAFIDDPSLHISFGNVVEFYSSDLDDATRSRLALREGVAVGIHPGTMLLRRQTFDEIGPFRTDQHLGEFIDWYARVQEANKKVEVMSTVFMRRRLHHSNWSREMANDRADYARSLGDVIRRRRQQRLATSPDGGVAGRPADREAQPNEQASP